MGERDYSREDLEQTEQQLMTRWEALSYQGLHEFERDWIRMFWLVGEVNNGSFHQYFHNSAGNEALETLDALSRLGLPKTYRILSDAIDEFGSAGYSPVRQERWERLETLHETAFDGPTKAFYGDGTEDVDRQALIRVCQEYQRLGIERAEPDAAADGGG